MKLEFKKWMSMTNVTVTLTILTVIMSWVFAVTSKFEKQVDNKQDVALAWWNAITTVSKYLSSTWNLNYVNSTSSWITYDLNEDQVIEVEIKKWFFWWSQSWNLNVTFDNTSSTSYLGIDANAGSKDIAAYWFDNWIIIDDCSLWTSAERTTYKTQQLNYLKNQQFADSAAFVENWSAKVDTPGSYIVYDFWRKVNLNAFEFWLSATWTVSPKVISLSFDNATRYNFSVDTSKAVQKLWFMDTLTRYVKVDVLAMDNWAWSVSNSILAGTTSLDPLNLSISNSSTSIQVSFPAIADSSIKFYNIYFSATPIKSTTPALVIPQKSGNITVNYSNFDATSWVEKPTNVWIEACQTTTICKTPVTKSLYNLVYNWNFESGSWSITNVSWPSSVIGSAADRWQFYSSSLSSVIWYTSSYSKEWLKSFKLSTVWWNYIEAMNEPGTYWSVQPNSIVLKPNTKYKLSGWLKTQYISGDSNHWANVWLWTTDMLWWNNSSLNLIPSYVKTTQDWTYYEKIFTTSGYTKYWHLQLRIYWHTWTANLTMNAWFDDIRLEEAP